MPQSFSISASNGRLTPAKTDCRTTKLSVPVRELSCKVSQKTSSPQALNVFQLGEIAINGADRQMSSFPSNLQYEAVGEIYC